MFLKDETQESVQKNIRIATSKKVTGGYSHPSEPITGKYWAGGPTVVNTGSKWIVYFHKYTQDEYGAIESNDLKTCTDVSDKLVMSKGSRHGTVFIITKAELAKFIHL